ncbi:MAG TPA: tetratricopeptide repeat protein [Tepidisphaeraceae bacterium]|jgi:tetratricopeptide (TPR) repeat protein|nr:tetratricopeptide repeat protein [Tepidisphaeraceae bacterium]
MRRFAAIFLLSALCGCAAQQATTKPTTQFAAGSDESSASLLTLDQIQPPVSLADIKPTTQPTTGPSLDAVELYARARGALMEGQRFSAIDLLEQAVRADPYSFDLRYDLGKAYAGVSTKNTQAIAAFEAAAKLDPDNIQVQTELGRQYLASDHPDEALAHLRLAIQTTQYQTDDDSAGLVDFYLARVLQQKGYDRAAIDRYDSLLTRLEHPTMAIRTNPELAFIAAHPEGLYLEVGRLYEKHHQLDLALRAYEFVATREPSPFENHARVVNVMVALRQNDAAIREATTLVEQYKASTESVALLKNVYKSIGREKEIVDELKKLQAKNPNDRAMLYALADALYDANRREEAASLLEDALARDPNALDIFRKLFGLYESRDDTIDAVKVLMSYLADHPDSLTELSPLWEKLKSISRKNGIHLTELQKLDVPPREMGCKLFLVSNQASEWNREVLARTSLEQATKQRPIFPQAFRDQINAIWIRQDWDDARKITESNALIDAVKKEDRNAFADELRGLLLLNQKNINDAINAFADAIKLGDPSPDLQLIYARALKEQGNERRFEQVLWKLIGDRPTYEQSYNELFVFYNAKGNEPQKKKVVALWRTNDPTNFHGRLAEAIMLMDAAFHGGGLTDFETVEAVLLEIFHDNPDQQEAIDVLATFYKQTGRIPELISRLEIERVRDPANRNIVTNLVDIYAQQKRLAEAIRVLDASRAAMGNDPDLLYSIAGLYEKIDQPQTSEEILAKVIAIDPQHAAANNDLGYSWADQGKNLDRAESMIRIAVDAEPDNESFLDSLGWVLYKRAKFDEAKGYFERAIAPATFPDPVVLDHLGDALYRVNDVKQAEQRWNEAMQRMATLDQFGMLERRSDLVKLRLTLIGKIRQAEQGKPVTVAPTVEQPPSHEQARN